MVAVWLVGSSCHDRLPEVSVSVKIARGGVTEAINTCCLEVRLALLLMYIHAYGGSIAPTAAMLVKAWAGQDENEHVESIAWSARDSGARGIYFGVSSRQGQRRPCTVAPAE